MKERNKKDANKSFRVRAEMHDVCKLRATYEIYTSCIFIEKKNKNYDACCNLSRYFHPSISDTTVRPGSTVLVSAHAFTFSIYLYGSW